MAGADQQREIAENPWVGLSTLTRWLSRERDAAEPSEAPVDLHAELKRLRRENAVLQQEHDILKKTVAFFAREGCGGWTPWVRENPPRVKFAFIDAGKASVPISRMCCVLDVSQSGFFAWQGRPASRRQQQDMVYLAPIRTAFVLSNAPMATRACSAISSTRAMRLGGIARRG